MSTIKRILERYDLTIEEIESYKKVGIVNNCWADGGFNFSDKVHKYANYLPSKGQKLIDDIDTVCNIHDIMFNRWKTFNDWSIRSTNLVEDRQL